MGYLKTLTSKDVIVTPFTVHKQFSYSGEVPNYNNGDIFFVLFRYKDYLFNSGEFDTGSKALVGHSLNQLFYANYGEGTGKIKEATTASFNPDGTITGEFSTTNYINSPQSIYDLRYFYKDSPSIDNGVLSIPYIKYGEAIKPGSFSASFDIGVPYDVTDDGEGNIINKNDGTQVGNIFYNSGIVTYIPYDGSGITTSGKIISPKWQSTTTIYETQYKCTINPPEYNFSLNETLMSGSSAFTYNSSSYYQPQGDALVDFATGSIFNPYVTGVGLYNDNQELLAIAKLAKPLPTSTTSDITIVINLDR